jgi:hypothetical protein
VQVVCLPDCHTKPYSLDYLWERLVKPSHVWNSCFTEDAEMNRKREVISNPLGRVTPLNHDPSVDPALTFAHYPVIFPTSDLVPVIRQISHFRINAFFPPHMNFGFEYILKPFVFCLVKHIIKLGPSLRNRQKPMDFFESRNRFNERYCL